MGKFAHVRPRSARVSRHRKNSSAKDALAVMAGIIAAPPSNIVKRLHSVNNANTLSHPSIFFSDRVLRRIWFRGL
jgi:hypothetical protein